MKIKIRCRIIRTHEFKKGIKYKQTISNLITINLQSKRPINKGKTITINRKRKKRKNLLIKLQIWVNLKLKSKLKTHLKALKSAKPPKINFGNLMTSYSQEENLPNLSKSIIFTKRICLFEKCLKNSSLQKWLQLSISLGPCKNQGENSTLEFLEPHLILMQ